MSRKTFLFEIALPGDVVEADCRAALRELGWQTSRHEPGVLKFREGIDGLPCCHPQAEGTIAIKARESSRVSIEVRTPGIGPISTSHARGRGVVLLAKIEEWLGRERPQDRPARSKQVADGAVPAATAANS